MTNSPACAVRLDQEHISYDQLAQDISHTRQWLLERITTGHHRVAIAVRAPYWHWVCTLALLQMGKVCASVLESPRLPGAVLSLFELWLTDQPGEMPGPSLRWEAAEVRSRRVPSSGSRTADAVALRLRLPASAQRWLLTSGTTGQAKVVVMSAADIQARLQAAAQQYGPDVGPQTQLLTLMGLDTIGAFLVTLLTWMRGGTVLLGTLTPSGQTNVTAALRDCNLLTASPARLKEVMDSAAVRGCG